MSSDIAIKVDGLGKCFQIYERPHYRLLQMLARGRRQYFREFWALRDVSFEIRKGETVGIIGRNGSGKSTLLQIICGTLNPSQGEVCTRGRIAALLELGSGFNPEFTGRENVYMNAAVLGLGKAEIDARFDDIAAFADIGDFIEQPVKTYSSGMMVRLAFAVAINVDPEILIVDEALSVGDELFQRKCFSRIEAIRASGATILFVSHSGSQIVELCDRAILLDSGEKLTEGRPKVVVGNYQRLLYAPADRVLAIRTALLARQEHVITPVAADSMPAGVHVRESKLSDVTDDFLDPGLRPGSTLSYESHGARIMAPRLLNVGGEEVNCIRRGRTYRYVYQVSFSFAATGVRFGMMIKTLAGVELGGSVSATGLDQALSYVTSGSVIDVGFEFQCLLNPGVYFLNAGVVGVAGETETYLHRLLDAYMFRVMPERDDTATGVVDFRCLADVQVVGDKKSD